MIKGAYGKEEQTEMRDVLMSHNLFIVWNPKYNIGIPIIDEQHRGIVTTINSMYFGIKNHFIAQTFEPVIHTMIDYTRIHFKIEETFMEKLDIVYAKRHHELHEELLGQLIYTGDQSQLNRNPHQFLDFLKGWWISHICNEDFQMRKLMV